MVEKRIEEKLFERSQNLPKSREGLSKLKRKILAEVKFLKSLVLSSISLHVRTIVASVMHVC